MLNRVSGIAGQDQSQGARQSYNENLIPEQLLSTEEQTLEGVSAAKALMIASQQGQRIYTVSAANAATVLPQLSHSGAVMEDIRHAVNAGKVVTVSQSPVTHAGWTGTGYAVADVQTGAVAYLIGGGADGAICLALGTVGLVMAVSAIIPAVMSGPAMITSLSAVTAALAASMLLIIEGLALLDETGVMEKKCATYAAGLIGISIGGLAGAAAGVAEGVVGLLYNWISLSQKLNALIAGDICGVSQ